MGDAVAQSDLDVLKVWARANSCVRRVWIFGSRARGEASMGSDLDVAVEIDAVGRDESAQLSWMDRSPGWRSELGKKLSVPIQLEWVGDTTPMPTVARGLARSSVLIYQRDE